MCKKEDKQPFCRSLKTESRRSQWCKLSMQFIESKADDCGFRRRRNLGAAQPPGRRMKCRQGAARLVRTGSLFKEKSKTKNKQDCYMHMSVWYFYLECSCCPSTRVAQQQVEFTVRKVPSAHLKGLKKRRIFRVIPTGFCGNAVLEPPWTTGQEEIA